MILNAWLYLASEKEFGIIQNLPAILSVPLLSNLVKRVINNHNQPWPDVSAIPTCKKSVRVLFQNIFGKVVSNLYILIIIKCTLSYHLCFEYFSQLLQFSIDSEMYTYRKVASSRPVYYSKVTGLRPKVTVHKDQISPS